MNGPSVRPQQTHGDGTGELRQAIKTAFPQLTAAQVAAAVRAMRAANRAAGGA